MGESALLWPRMDRSAAVRRLESLGESCGPDIDLSTDKFSFSGVGTRAVAKEIELLRNGVVAIATEYGFHPRYGYDQDNDPGDDGRSAFDAAIFTALPHLLPMNWSEAGSREVWSWVAIAVLPDVTHWRWKWRRKSGNWNAERWIGSDLSRHTWARQWWRSVQLADDPDLATLIREAEFNQITERADTIGANPLLVTTFARRFLEYAETASLSRRDLLRDAAQRLLREMHFIDDSAMGATELREWSDRVLVASIEGLLRSK